MAILPGVPVAKAEAATNLISNGTFEKDVEGFPLRSHGMCRRCI
jgi:hypothetical protein